MSWQANLPIHRIAGHNIDISLVWHLFFDGDNNIVINGQKTIFFCPKEEYIELEKHYYAYRGQNRRY